MSRGMASGGAWHRRIGPHERMSERRPHRHSLYLWVQILGRTISCSDSYQGGRGMMSGFEMTSMIMIQIGGIPSIYRTKSPPPTLEVGGGGRGGGVGGGGRGGVEKVGGGYGGGRRCTHKAEHTKGGLWPPQESCYLRGHRQGGAHRRRCTHKAEHTKGGLWPPQESCYLRGHRQGGAHRRRCTHKAEHTKGGLWPPQESCYLRGHRQGGTRRRLGRLDGSGVCMRHPGMPLRGGRGGRCGTCRSPHRRGRGEGGLPGWG